MTYARSSIAGAAVAMAACGLMAPVATAQPVHTETASKGRCEVKAEYYDASSAGVTVQVTTNCSDALVSVDAALFDPWCKEVNANGNTTFGSVQRWSDNHWPEPYIC